MKLLFVEILKELKASGYKVSARLLNAMYFHVPQSRERMIFIGVREDLEVEPSHPKAESRPITVKEAFKCVESGESPIMSPALAKVAPLIKPWGDGGQVTKNKFFSTKRLHWARPARTIGKDMVGSRSAMLHPEEHRAISDAEAKRVGSFPDAYILGSPKNAMMRIGNSVPPLFMEAIARHIKTQILKFDG